MPNTLTTIFTSSPATEPVDAAHPNTGVIVQGTQLGNGTWQVVHTLVNKTTTPPTIVGQLRNYTAVTASIVASGNVVNNVLAAPTGLAVTPTNSTTIGASWNAVLNASGYLLEQATNSTFTTGLATAYAGPLLSFSNTGLTASTGYYYRVSTTGGGFYDSSGPSAGLLATTSAPTALPAYVGPYAPITDDAANNFDWTPDSNATPLSEFEVSVLGAAPVTVTVKPFNVGNIDIPEGGVGVRRKASGTNSASAYQYNTVAFTTLFNLPQPTSATAWASLSNATGANYYDSTASLLLTTTASASAVGSNLVAVSSATGILANSLLDIGTQRVNVLSVSGTTLTLAKPLASATVTGQNVAHVLVSGVTDSRLNVGAPISLTATLANKVRGYRNTATNVSYAETDGVGTGFLANNYMIDQNTVFLCVEIGVGTGPGYVLETNAPGSPGLIYNYTAGTFELFGYPTRATIKNPPAGRMVLGIVRTAATTKVYYADSANPVPVLLLDLPNNGAWTSRNIMYLGDGLKMHLYEYALYSELALTQADSDLWMSYLATRYLQSASGVFSPEFSTQFA